MNYAIAKIGQRIIFDRDSSACDRSNTNGNVGTYLLFRLLAETNPDDVFYVISDNDGAFTVENMVDASNMSEDDLRMIGIDAMFVLTGLTEYEQGTRLFDLINNLPSKFILMSDDPRCLDSVEREQRVKRVPNKIVSQFEGWYCFKGCPILVEYVPLQTASCYKCDALPLLRSGKWDYLAKDTDTIVVANTSGKEYDRVKILSELIKFNPKIPVYGRLSLEEKKLLGEKRCMGELKFEEIQGKLALSFNTILVPIKKGWVTSKYVEALMNRVIPIFHEDYAAGLLGCNGLIIVKDSASLNLALKDIKDHRQRYSTYVNYLIKELIFPYIDGKTLSKKLIECAGGK